MTEPLVKKDLPYESEILTKKIKPLFLKRVSMP